MSSVSLTDLPGRSAQALPGGIRAQACSALCALLEFPQPDGTTAFFGQFQLSSPAQPSGCLAPPVMFVETRRHPPGERY